jgi:hypothetical protein
MTTFVSRATLVTLVACTMACGDSREAPFDASLDGPPDTALPHDARSDAPADARPDARPDAPPAIDVDRDGHPADTDCDDNDPDVWQTLPYSFRDADGDGHTVAHSGAICSGASLPAGYSLMPGAADCNDADPAVFTELTGFLDLDGDGVGVGAAMAFCTAGELPANFAATGGDCAPADAAHWQDLLYGFRDADGDGAVVSEVGIVCSGATLPPTYFASVPPSQPFDCDDSNASVSIALTVFADLDHDGVGAGSGQPACTNGSAPAGFSISSTDCDDSDGSVWMSLLYAAVDFDGDGVTAPALGMRCTAGTLLPPYYATAIGNDCDDDHPDVFIALTIFADGDGDGSGAGPSQLACTNGSPPDGFSTTGTDCDDGDASRWALLAYHAIDSDGDGVTVPANGEVCTDGTLPSPFKANPNGNDCNDTDATLTHLAVLYPDRDGDGVGAPPRQIVCIGTTPPDGLVRGGFDDDDNDPSVIETDDDELDLLLLGG